MQDLRIREPYTQGRCGKEAGSSPQIGILDIPTFERSTTHEDEDPRQGEWHRCEPQRELADLPKATGLKVKTASGLVALC